MIPVNYSSQYSVITNVESVDEAQIICLGETHSSGYHRKINGAVIDSLYRPGDIVLVEGEVSSEGGKKHSAQISEVKNPVEIRSWDIVKSESDRKFHEAMSSEITFRFFMNIGVILASFIGSKILKATYGTDYYLGAVGRGVLPTVSIASLGIKMLRRTYDKLPIRNRNMCETIEEESGLGKNRRIFVIAGITHFQECHPFWKTIGFSNEGTIHETMKYLEGKKFAILIPRGIDFSFLGYGM